MGTARTGAAYGEGGVDIALTSGGARNDASMYIIGCSALNSGRDSTRPGSDVGLNGRLGGEDGEGPVLNVGLVACEWGWEGPGCLGLEGEEGPSGAGAGAKRGGESSGEESGLRGEK